jgi:DNA-binding PadR family transcriptional regulator
MEATKLEVLLAVATSEFEKTTHVHFMPVGKSFVNMLKRMRSTGCVEPLNEKHYTLTKKGWYYIRKQNIEQFKDIDAQIDNFVNKLK